MYRVFFTVFLLFCVSCTGTVVLPKSSEVQTAVSPEPPATKPPEPTLQPSNKPKKETLIKVVSVGYGASKSAALQNAKVQASLEAAEFLVYEGELFILHPKDAELLLQKNYEKFLAGFDIISEKQVGTQYKTEILALINSVALIARVHSTNGANFSMPADTAKKLTSDISSASKERAAIKEEFRALLGDFEKLINARIVSVKYDEVRLQEGKVPVIIAFELYVDRSYNEKARKLIDIFLKHLGGNLAKEVDIITNNDELPSFTVNSNRNNRIEDILSDHVFSIAIDNKLKIYYVGEEYLTFYRKSYLEHSLTGDPFNLQMAVKLKNNNGKILYEDFFNPFNYQFDSSYEPEPVKSYPSVYIVNESRHSNFNGRFLNNSPSHNLEGAINSYFSLSITDNPLKGNARGYSRNYDKNLIKHALITPYFTIRIHRRRASVKIVKMEYEGLIDAALVKSITSAELDYIR